MQVKKVYTSIDIGSDTIKFVTAEYYNNNYYVLASFNIKSKGIRKGLIFDSNLFINAIKDGIKVMNERLGFNIKKVIVSIPDYNAKFMFVTGSTMITDSITSADISKVIKSSVYNKLDDDYELVTVLPVAYAIDEKECDSHIIGKKANKLDVKGVMISVPKKNMYSVISAIHESGLEVVDVAVSGLGDYFEVRNNFTDKSVGAIVNIGHETVNVSIFNKGNLMNTETLQIGGLNVDKDLSFVFGINPFDGRVLKEKFASAHKRMTNVGDLFEVKNNYGEMIRLNQLEVSEVVMSRLKQILDFVNKQIAILSKKEVNYIIITGGLTEIKSFKNLVFENMGKDVIMFKEETLGARSNKYTTALGMIKYYVDKMNKRGKDYSMITEDDENKLVNVKKNSKSSNESITSNQITKLLEGIFKGKEER